MDSCYHIEKREVQHCGKALRDDDNRVLYGGNQLRVRTSVTIFVISVWIYEMKQQFMKHLRFGNGSFKPVSLQLSKTVDSSPVFGMHFTHTDGVINNGVAVMSVMP